MLDEYIDIEATAKRVAERTAAAVTLAREALSQAEAEVLRAQEALARIERDYHAGDISGKQWSAQEAKLAGGLQAAQEAVRHAQGHVQHTEQAGVAGDAEKILLDHLAALKQAASAQADAAPDLAALRNVIAQIFESVLLVRCRKSPAGYVIEAPRKAAGVVLNLDDPDLSNTDLAIAKDGDLRYVLWTVLRSEAVDATGSPIGHEMPVGSMLQYPPTDPNPFLCRYCWW